MYLDEVTETDNYPILHVIQRNMYDTTHDTDTQDTPRGHPNTVSRFGLLTLRRTLKCSSVFREG